MATFRALLLSYAQTPHITENEVMRYMGLQVYGLLALAACAGAQAAPTPSATPSTTAQERAVREQEIALRARERAERVRLRSEQVRVRRDSLRVRAQARRLVADSALMNRATLGVTLGQTGNRRDTLGIFVSAVAPDGPAERAGIYEGDRIASINGVDVRTQASDAGDAYLAGVAQRRLTLELRKLTPGQRVNVRVWSGGRYKDVQVTTARYTEVYRNRRTQIRIGSEGPLLIPDIHVAPLTPGRTMMHVPAVPAVPALPSVVELDLPDFAIAAEAAARVAAELPEIDLLEALAPLAELETELLNDIVVDVPLDFDVDFDVDFDSEVEVDADLPSANDMDAIAQEALRQAHETLSALDRQFSAL